MDFVNALINETSPYLLQHAHNPVNWYPWGDIAFNKSRQENKPIFLSIGYSTCHWCHVMERESFEDIEVAKLLNDDFIAVKVDREERPDIDTVYMNVCEALTGSGGWPLTIIMTPEGKPFFAGTYFPKKSAYGRTGVCELLAIIANVWKNERDKVFVTSEQIFHYINKRSSADVHIMDNDKRGASELMDKGFAEFSVAYDEKYGGFGDSPKFPSPHNLIFLMEYGKNNHARRAQDIAENTLLHMYLGGIYDHIGGGFSRYSTDNMWLVPHFEKMLYDNALLIYAYALYIEIGKKEDRKQLFKKIIAQTVNYLTTELLNQSGGFYCSQDADSDGKEGSYYLFTPEEIHSLLDNETAGNFCAAFGIRQGGHLDGKSVPNLIGNEHYLQADTILNKMRAELITYRKKRSKLFTDDKILTSWNALAIAALAKAGRVTADGYYIELAEKAAKFIENNLTDSDGALYVSYRNGEKKIKGQLSDYAFYSWALLELYQSSLNVEYLSCAAQTAEKMYLLFKDDKNLFAVIGDKEESNTGGLYFSQQNEHLIIRPKTYYDGAIPSGNSVAAFVFSKLYSLTAEIKWKRRSENLFATISGKAKNNPSGYGFSLFAMAQESVAQSKLICVSPYNEIPKIIKELSNIQIILKNPSNSSILGKCAPYINSYPVGAETVYYYCHGGKCEKPITSEEELMKLIKPHIQPEFPRS